MDKKYWGLIILVFLSNLSYAQLFPYNPQEWDVKWTTTEFSDYFDGISLKTDKWNVATDFERGNCVFVDLPDITYSVNNERLHLSMIYQPGYCYTDKGITKCPSYISAEISYKESYKYGNYEGRMKFSVLKGSWPAFWFFGGS